jgi:hypothetical protein
MHFIVYNLFFLHSTLPHKLKHLITLNKVQQDSVVLAWRHDNQRHDIQHNDTQDNS